MTRKTGGGKSCSLSGRYSKNAKRLVRQYSQHEISLAIKNWIFEPARLGRVVRENTAWQRVSQRFHRDVVQRPELCSPSEVVRRPPTHPLAGLFAPSKLLNAFFKRIPCSPRGPRVAFDPVNREFIGADTPAPVDELPGRCCRIIAWREIPLNEDQYYLCAASAPSSAFHASSAHFTRAGKRATPDSALNGPSAFSPAAVASPSMRSRNRFLIASISAALLPFTNCVIIDADACDIEQPRPENLRSATLSPANAT